MATAVGKSRRQKRGYWWQNKRGNWVWKGEGSPTKPKPKVKIGQARSVGELSSDATSTNTSESSRETSLGSTSTEVKSEGSSAVTVSKKPTAYEQYKAKQKKKRQAAETYEDVRDINKAGFKRTQKLLKKEGYKGPELSTQQKNQASKIRSSLGEQRESRFDLRKQLKETTDEATRAALQKKLESTQGKIKTKSERLASTTENAKKKRQRAVQKAMDGGKLKTNVNKPKSEVTSGATATGGRPPSDGVSATSTSRASNSALAESSRGQGSRPVYNAAMGRMQSRRKKKGFRP